MALPDIRQSCSIFEKREEGDGVRTVQLAQVAERQREEVGSLVGCREEGAEDVCPCARAAVLESRCRPLVAVPSVSLCIIAR